MKLAKFSKLFEFSRDLRFNQALFHCRRLHYVQGQYGTNKRREYFYYIDHHGQLFLDDARMKNFTSCFKETKFLHFFFSRLKYNDSGSYNEDFPYMSPCGRERNYIRCDDLPIVFTKILQPEDPSEPTLFSYCGANELLTVPFHPEKICMLPESGRIYHPGPPETGGVGLVKSSLAIEMSKSFEFGDSGEYDPPTHFTWAEEKYELKNDIVELLRKEYDRVDLIRSGKENNF
ncbi:hypothetical protein CAPTEDRAFT_177483 [Capitella teleta]|uniref:Uncharacterized protein n=1 Tax=Capitella teleta TaxID=283909 RepID=R7TM14_CAPTE|nr:hypothetical protein CAPTEDRAFT_177483 [Capitella teleta]|eukprot:ELT94848.1 hypothetical protein CAPTEDRAFT_177483 [Capitella teleta]